MSFLPDTRYQLAERTNAVSISEGSFYVLVKNGAQDISPITPLILQAAGVQMFKIWPRLSIQSSSSRSGSKRKSTSEN